MDESQGKKRSVEGVCDTIVYRLVCWPADLLELLIRHPVGTLIGLLLMFVLLPVNLLLALPFMLVAKLATYWRHRRFSRRSGQGPSVDRLPPG